MRTTNVSVVEVRCGGCGRRIKDFTVQKPEDWAAQRARLGESFLIEPLPAVPNLDPSSWPSRLTFQCHWRRCGRTYPFRRDTWLSMLRGAVDAGRREIWLA
jgi:hypothetical protein